jgi:acyl carrier protein
MSLDKFVQLFAEQFDDTPAESFSPTTVFKDLDEYDSLVTLSIIAMVDEEYEKRITGADLNASETVEDLYNLIQTK